MRRRIAIIVAGSVYRILAQLRMRVGKACRFAGAVLPQELLRASASRSVAPPCIGFER